MQIIKVERRAVADSILKSTPSVEHGPLVVQSPVTLVENGRPVLRVVNVPVPTEYRAACINTKASTGTRTRGLVTTSTSFGTMPRSVFANHCRSAALAREAPADHSALTRMSSVLVDQYREMDPDGFERYAAAAAKIPAEYRMGPTPFTSGQVNKNVVLAYHLDVGNTRDGLSAMMVVRERSTGGLLVVPEYGVTLDLRDGDVSLFDGQHTWHGVTPVETLLGGYRTSVVYFTLRSAWSCLPWTAELAKAKALATKKARGAARKVDCDCDGPHTLACLMGESAGAGGK